VFNEAIRISKNHMILSDSLKSEFKKDIKTYVFNYFQHRLDRYSPSRIETEGMQCCGTCICVYSTSV